jgi:hypothetical protein
VMANGRENRLVKARHLRRAQAVFTQQLRDRPGGFG